MKNQDNNLIIGGIIAIVIKLIAIIGSVVVSATLGLIPETAQEYFKAIDSNIIVALLRDDFFNLILITMYFFSFAAIFQIQNSHNKSLTVMAIIFTYISIILTITAHTGLSMVHLSKQYLTTDDPIIRTNMIAAGEAVLSKNVWNSTSGLFSGILMQGAGVMISLAMIGNHHFRKITIISGITCNGLDLINHVLHYSMPSIAIIFLSIAGLFYLVWFVTLGLDFLRYSKSRSKDVAEQP